MYDEAIMDRFLAYCRDHPEWFTEQYLALVVAMVALDDPAPDQQAWSLLLDRFVEGEAAGEDGGEDGGEGEDRPVSMVGWKPRR